MTAELATSLLNRANTGAELLSILDSIASEGNAHERLLNGNAHERLLNGNAHERLFQQETQF